MTTNAAGRPGVGAAGMVAQKVSTTIPVQLALDVVPRPGDPGPEVRAICDLIAGDPIHARDRSRVISAIVADARAHDGHIDTNRVRAKLTGPWGLTVHPRVVGATYLSLTSRGVLTFAGWTLNTDRKGRNSGKPARTYRLVRAA